MHSETWKREQWHALYWYPEATQFIYIRGSMGRYLIPIDQGAPIQLSMMASNSASDITVPKHPRH